MTGSTIKSTVPSDSAEKVRVMAVPRVATPLFKEAARPPLAPAKTQREARLSEAQSGAGNSKIHQSQACHRLGKNGHRG